MYFATIRVYFEVVTFSSKRFAGQFAEERLLSSLIIASRTDGEFGRPKCYSVGI